jgi:hypothetical protein
VRRQDILLTRTVFGSCKAVATTVGIIFRTSYKSLTGEMRFKMGLSHGSHCCSSTANQPREFQVYIRFEARVYGFVDCILVVVMG